MHSRGWVKFQNKNSNKFSNEASQGSTVLHGSVSGLSCCSRIEPDRPENMMEYAVGEDDEDVDMESEKTDNSSSESDDEDKRHPDDAESDSNSSSTDCSSDSSNSPQSRNTATVVPNIHMSMCAGCGRGPFRSMKLHLLHCSGVKVKYQCSLCKELFPTEKSLREHYMPLYSCDVCGQVCSHENAYRHHTCPKQGKPPLVLFCAESMPHACNICKSFFTTEKTLLSHVARVHTSVVSTKVCIITNPSGLSSKKVSTADQVVLSPNVVNHVSNGKLSFGPTTTRPPIVSPAAHVKSEKEDSPPQPTTQLSGRPPAPSLDPAPDTTQSPVNSQPDSPPMASVVALFKHRSQDVALMKRMNTGWRSKAPYPCRQCGAVLRQPSLIISHRYLHRGQRSHRCQCGRAFKHRLHLLRHCIQHAESMSYICVGCGETFTGAKLLAKHMRGKPRKTSTSGHKWKSGARRKCRMSFTCECGQIFIRPSAYIWHQLQNRTQLKRLKKSVK